MEYDETEGCWSCGYVLWVHEVARPGTDPDPNGGCPENEIVVMLRAGIL